MVWTASTALAHSSRNRSWPTQRKLSACDTHGARRGKGSGTGMYQVPDDLDQLDNAHTAGMIRQHIEMANDINMALVRLSKDPVHDPDYGPADAGYYALRSVLHVAVELLQIESYGLHRGQSELLPGHRWAYIAKLECAYKIISTMYVTLATQRVVQVRPEIEGPSIKSIRDLVDLSKTL